MCSPKYLTIYYHQSLQKTTKIIDYSAHKENQDLKVAAFCYKIHAVALQPNFLPYGRDIVNGNLADQ